MRMRLKVAGRSGRRSDSPEPLAGVSGESLPAAGAWIVNRPGLGQPAPRGQEFLGTATDGAATPPAPDSTMARTEAVRRCGGEARDVFARGGTVCTVITHLSNCDQFTYCKS